MANTSMFYGYFSFITVWIISLNIYKFVIVVKMHCISGSLKAPAMVTNTDNRELMRQCIFKRVLVVRDIFSVWVSGE